IPSGLPHIVVPKFRADLMPTLLRPAVTVAMLGAIESLMSAVVADRMGNDRHNPNVELLAQGVANIASPLFGGLPATGAIARTATNIRSGARTPVSGMLHAATLLVVLLVAAPAARFIPLSGLAAILLVVAYNVGVFRIHGPFLFGATDKISRIVDHVAGLAPIVIVRLRNMTAIDATGLRALEDLADRLHSSGRELILCGAPKQPAALMHQAE